MINVVLVDDHNLVRTGIKCILKNAPNIQIIGEAENGDIALKLIKELQPDVLLMDIMMPGLSGLSLLKELLTIKPDLKVLIVTSCDNEIFSASLLKAGAMGYFVKKMGEQELINAINKVHNGQRYISFEAATQLALPEARRLEKPMVDILSKREYEVMLLLIKGYSILQISHQLNLRYKTISTLRSRIFDKLKVGSNVELTQFAIRSGLLQPKD
ncbi:MAG: response regulator transcription factor [Gammaproteobacteria bacterium]